MDNIKTSKSLDIKQDALPLIMPIVKKVLKIFNFEEGKFKNLCDFIYICYAYFGG